MSGVNDKCRGGVLDKDALGELEAGGEIELATRSLQIQSKRFYIDVKQNRRGRFVKIAEVGTGGRKSRILMAMSTAAEFRDKLTDFNKFYSDLGTSGSGDGARGEEDAANGETGKLKTESMTKDNRRYFLDLKENSRGRFLRITQQLNPTGLRSQVALPAQGIIEVRDKLTELLEEFGTDDHADGTPELPETNSMRVDNKMFYFDVGSNRRGVFLRVSEVRTNLRTAITLPEHSWARFRDILNEYVEHSSSAAASDSPDSRKHGKKTISAGEESIGGNENIGGDVKVEDIKCDAASSADTE